MRQALMPQQYFFFCLGKILVFSIKDVTTPQLVLSVELKRKASDQRDVGASTLLDIGSIGRLA